MIEPGVSNVDEWQLRARRVRQQFDESGTTISEWSRQRGFDPKLVAQIMRGDRPCRRGASHRIAVALGIKQSSSGPGAAL